MIDQSHALAKKGKIMESDDLYVRCYTVAYNMLASHELGMFSDEELNFLNKIITEFNYEQEY
jgi:hypothetical protein